MKRDDSDLSDVLSEPYLGIRLSMRRINKVQEETQISFGYEGTRQRKEQTGPAMALAKLFCYGNNLLPFPFDYHL